MPVPPSIMTAADGDRDPLAAKESLPPSPRRASVLEALPMLVAIALDSSFLVAVNELFFLRSSARPCVSVGLAEWRVNAISGDS